MNLAYLTYWEGVSSISKEWWFWRTVPQYPLPANSICNLNCIVATNSFGILANFYFAQLQGAGKRYQQAVARVLYDGRSAAWLLLVLEVAMIRCRSAGLILILIFRTRRRHGTRPGRGPTGGSRSCSEERSVARPSSGSARPRRKQVTCEPLCTGGRFNPRLAQAKAEMLSTRPPPVIGIHFDTDTVICDD